MNNEDLYIKLPIFFQNALINIQGLRIRSRRLNSNFCHFLKYYRQSNPKEVDLKYLRVFLQEANKTPFWSKQFSIYNLNLNEKDILNEIQKLPILEKAFVKANKDLFINPNDVGRRNTLTTSGTTGSALVFPQTDIMENKQWAIWWRYRMRHGISTNTWMGWFAGRNIANPTQSKPPYWRTVYPLKQIMFSAHHLNIDTVEYYYEKIINSKLTWLHGYPSQLAFLASLIKEKNLTKFQNIKLITTGGENLLDNQRSIIQEIFNAPLRQHYGSAEGVANISEDKHGNLVPDQDFCYTEFIPLNKKEPNICKIIGTNYSNSAFPLIRYDTGDIAFVERDEKDNIINVLSFDGRQEDYIIRPDGVKIGRLDYIFREIESVAEAQIYQKSIDSITLRIVKRDMFQEGVDDKKILNEARKKLGNSIKIEFEYMTAIPRTNSGKLRFVISEINN